MKKRSSSLVVGLALTLITAPVFGATYIVSDNFTAANVNSGFLPGEGVNSGINPPTVTRLTGTAVANLSYLKKGNKGDTAYTISGNKCNITQGSQSGRFTISEDGVNAFDFGPALGVANATPENPIVYDVAISMNNKVSTNAATVGRMTFGFGTVEGGGGNWSFGIQILPTSSGNYNIYKRIKIAASGLGAELNAVITNDVANASEVSFLMRVTDAGAETETYSSRVQLSINGGTTWFYDTQTDADLVNGWHLDTGARFVSFDQAPNGGADTYDNFSIAFPFPLVWTGNGEDNYWSTATNWLGGVIPVTGPTITVGDALVFSGTTQPGNVNDLNDLSVSSITFDNGGFTLSGNPFTVTTGITNTTGDNVLDNIITLGAN